MGLLGMLEKSITIKLNNGWMDGRVPCFGNGQSSRTSSLATAAVVVWVLGQRKDGDCER